MKTLNITFETEEYKQLLKKKNKLSWHDFIIMKCLNHDKKPIDSQLNDKPT